jgi:hypothetical protein
MGNYTLGSYEEWARVMGGILDYIGVPGFLGNLSANDEVNSAEAEWRGFVRLWWDSFQDNELTIKELYGLAMEHELLNSVMGEGQCMSQRTKLGLALRQEARERRIILKCETFRWNPAGNQSRPAEPGQQPEASLAWGRATVTAKRRQRDQTLCD